MMISVVKDGRYKTIARHIYHDMSINKQSQENINFNLLLLHTTRRQQSHKIKLKSPKFVAGIFYDMSFIRYDFYLYAYHGLQEDRINKSLLKLNLKLKHEQRSDNFVQNENSLEKSIMSRMGEICIRPATKFIQDGQQTLGKHPRKCRKSG